MDTNSQNSNNLCTYIIITYYLVAILYQVTSAKIKIQVRWYQPPKMKLKQINITSCWYSKFNLRIPVCIKVC